MAPRGLELQLLRGTGQDVVKALAVLRNEGIQVDRGADAIRQSVRDAGDHAAAVGIAAQHETAAMDGKVPGEALQFPGQGLDQGVAGSDPATK